MELDLNTSIQKFLENNSENSGIIQIGNENTITIVAPETTSKCTEECVYKLKISLQDLYQQLTLPKLSWLDEGVDLPLKDFYMQLQLDKDKTLIELNDIFNFDCNRILIESKPGYGKTTLCIKLLYDWANDASYTDQFQLAFLVPLRNLPEEGIEEWLATMTTDFGINKNDLIDILNELGEQVLIVLDGFDEIAKDLRINILRIIYRKLFCKATVVLTCRSNEYYVQSEDLEKIFGTSAFQKNFSNIKYTILGIGEYEVSKFIHNISQHCDIARLRKISKINPELSQSPLFVIMFVYLVSCSENIEELNTETKLYSSLFNCIMKRSLARDKVKVSENFNIFDIKDKCSMTYQELLQEFGEFSFQNSTFFKLQFDVCDLTEKVYKLGFLVKHKKNSLFKTTSHFEAFHKSVLEFIAAYTIWRRCSLLDFNVNEEVLKRIVCVFMHHKNALVLPFFFGLCESKLFQLLKALKSYMSLYGNVEEFVWEIAARNKFQANFLREFCNFIPLHTCASSLSSEDLKLGLVSCQIKKVCIIDDDLTPLPNIKIPELRWIVTDETKLENHTLSHLRGVECSNFIVDLQFGSIRRKNFEHCLQSFGIVESEKNIIININSEIFSSLPRQFAMDGIKINHIDCLLSGKDKDEFERFRQFATSFKIDSLIKCEVLENTFTRSTKLVEIIALLPTSSDAVVVGKSGERIVFSVKGMSDDDKREWYQNVSKSTFISQFNYKTINYLNVNSPDRDLLRSILKVTSLFVLRCLSNQLFYAFDTLPSSWPGFNDLRELSLILCDDLNPTFWGKVKKFLHLQSLELQMMCKLKSSDHVDAFLECLLSLNIMNLSFHFEVKDDNNFTGAFVKKLKQVSHKSTYALNTISVISIHNCDHLFVSDLLECLKMKLLMKVQFIVSPDVWKVVVNKIGNDYYSTFQVSHFLESAKNSIDNPAQFRLPIAFTRVIDSTQQVTYIQVQLK